jgi:hypothetical protein
VLLHQNNLPLYTAPNASDSSLGFRKLDYMMLGLLGGWVTGVAPYLILPFVACASIVPRRLAIMHYFTFHAELMPHTEQVTFLKADFFGNTRQIIVDIHNLEKIETDQCPNQLMFMMKVFDNNMIFRDMESKEIFVFHSEGMWN